MSDQPSRFSLRVAGVSHEFLVTRFAGRERVNGLYRFDLDVLTSRRIATDQRALLGRAATLTILDAQGAPRRVHGVIAAQRVEGHPAPGDLRRVRLRLVPRMWLLTQRVRSRVFHQMTPLAIVASVLREWNLDLTVRVVETARPLTHCVQYRERDADFVARILARHGLAWWFEHPERADEGDTFGQTLAELDGVTVARDPDAGPDSLHARERIVIANAAQAYDALPAALCFDDQRAGEHPIRRFESTARLRPTAQRTLLYRPEYFQADDGAYPVDRYDEPTTRETRGLEGRLGLELDAHEFEGASYPGGTATARVRLEQARVDAHTCRGTSVVPALRPGARFTLEQHPWAEHNRPWAVREVVHRGSIAEAQGSAEAVPVAQYENRFVCVPHDVLVRPTYRRPPARQVVERATIVGNVANDTMVEAFGYVKVRFCWDTRHLANEDDRCCWARKLDAWAGVGMGVQFTPRAGMEVLVSFFDGDVDQPVVLGGLYNEQNVVPFLGTQTSRRNGIRTQSVGDPYGYNELSFEDLHGREQVFVRAQRDLDVEVRHNHTARVRGSVEQSVGGHVRTHIHQRLGLEVDRDVEFLVGGDLARSVVGSESVKVLGDEARHVNGSSDRSVGRDLALNVGRDVTVDVARNLTASVHGDEGASLRTEGPMHVNSHARVNLTAREGITLRCGDSVLALTPEGIELDARTLILRGHRSVRLAQDFVALTLDMGELTVDASTVTLRSPTSSVTVGEDLDLFGTRVRIATGGAEPPHGDTDATNAHAHPPTLHASLRPHTDEHGAPVGTLILYDAEGRSVREIPASEGTFAGGLLHFDLPVADLPDPLEAVYVHGGTQQSVFGPASPAGLHRSLTPQHAPQAAPMVGRGHAVLPTRSSR